MAREGAGADQRIRSMVPPNRWLRPARMALAIAGAYACIGFLWIALSDGFVASLDLPPDQITRLQNLKGWAYVAVTAALLYGVLHYLFARLERTRKQVEAGHTQLTVLNRLYRVLRTINGAVVRSENEYTLMQEACRAAVVEGDCELAWVGLPTPDGTELQPAAHAGCPHDALRDLRLAFTDGEAAANLLALRAVIENRSLFLPGDIDDRADATTTAQLDAFGYRAMAALPLPLEDDQRGVLALYSRAPDAFAMQRAQSLLQEIANGLAVGLIYHRRGSRLEDLARYDPVTGIANRRLLEQRLLQTLSQAERQGTAAAVIVLDIDDFHTANDLGGRAIGDSILQKVAATLTGRVRPDDAVARMGNDEFAIVLSDLPSGIDEVSARVRRITDCFPLHVEREGQHYSVTASLGIAVYPLDAQDVDELLAHAELALASRPHGHRSSVLFYAPELNERARSEQALSNALHGALERGEFYLAYQPIVSLADERLTGCEALLRWQHPQLGAVSPGRFIPVAERSGLIQSIGDWVLQQVCAQLHQFPKSAGKGPFQICINAALQQLQDPGFPEQVGRALEGFDSTERQLVIELTESQFMRDPERTTETCRSLRALGCAIHLDDFGTGYSALNYLTQLPLDGLKIDRSFVARIAESGNTRSVVEAVTTLARGLDLEVIAEGVENAAQLNGVRALGCNQAQGYYFGHPGALENLLHLQHRPTQRWGRWQHGRRRHPA